MLFLKRLLVESWGREQRWETGERGCCAHTRTRARDKVLGVIKAFAKRSFQSLAFCPSAGRHPASGWAKTPRPMRAARPPHATSRRCLLGHGLRVTEADRLSPPVPTFVDCNQLTRDKTWAGRPGEETLLGHGLGAKAARCLLVSQPGRDGFECAGKQSAFCQITG